VAPGDHVPGGPFVAARARQFATISADGHVVAWQSENAIFARDLSGPVERIDVDSNENAGAGPANFPKLSDDGRFVAFQSRAANLVAGDNNGATDVFVRDRLTGTTSLVGVDSAGLQFPTGAGVDDISGDGRYVLFGSASLWVRDRLLGSTSQVKPPESQAGGPAMRSSLSADGRYVTFNSRDNLAPGASGTDSKVFRYDRTTGTTALVSVRLDGGTGTGLWPSISGEGRYVLFWSRDDGLVENDDDDPDLFRRDMATGLTVRVPMDAPEVEVPTAVDFPPTISHNGRYVSFTVLVYAGYARVFHYDFDGGDFTLIGTRSPLDAVNSGISADGRYVAHTLPELTVDGELISQIEVEVAPTMDITGGVPLSVARGTSASVTISGSNLDEVVGLFGEPGSGVTFSDVVATENDVHATVSAAVDAPAGHHDLDLEASTPGPGFDGHTSNRKTCFNCIVVTTTS